LCWRKGVSFAGIYKYNKYHHSVKSEYYDLLEELKSDNEYEEYNFINNALAIEKVKDLNQRLVNNVNNLNALNKQVSIYAKSINQNRINNNLSIFECPCCSHKLRITRKVQAQVTCNNCGYKFIINTGVDESDFKFENNFKDDISQKIRSWFK